MEGAGRRQVTHNIITNNAHLHVSQEEVDKFPCGFQLCLEMQTVLLLLEVCLFLPVVKSHTITHTHTHTHTQSMWSSQKDNTTSTLTSASRNSASMEHTCSSIC